MEKLLKLCLAATVFSLGILSCREPARTAGTEIIPGEVWLDTEGRIINAHGGGILFHDGRYYWYGECKGDSTYRLDYVKTWECWRADTRGVSCYSSDNLVDWRFEGLVLPYSDDPDSELHPSQVVERPKVIYNEKTGKFVMWMHIESPDYEKAHAGVAVSDSPVGPFTYLGSFKPNGGDSRDQTIFKDDDGRAYQIYSSEWNKTMYVGLLSEDYLSHTGVYSRIFIGESREAPAVFKHEGKYYLITSGCTGWDPNQARCAVADSLLGEWTVLGNPCTGKDADSTFHAQSTFVLPLEDGRYVAMFDRWNKTSLVDSRYVWLPLTFRDGRPVIEWTDRWSLSVRPREKRPGMEHPLFVYNNWSAYDELSDTIPQTEELCMRMLDKLIAMKRSGVRVDAYLMDAFWFDEEGGYRVWNRKHWPDGPERWISKCKENGIIPGLWFSTNLIQSGGKPMLRPVEAWEGSIATDPALVSLFDGGYLEHLMETLQQYADMGVRLFKFDFAYFDAATPDAWQRMTKEAIVEANKTAFMRAIRDFRQKNPDVKFLAYNGFGGIMENTTSPFGRYVDLRWLDVFDTLYSGDPRFSDVPMFHLWRSEDLYSDHQVRQYLASGIPGRRIDDCSLMIGTTGTCYRRGLAAWKSSTLLNLSRPGWMKVCHGNIDLLTEADVDWLAKAQDLFYGASSDALCLGGIPGRSEVYGYRRDTPSGTLITVVNPGQETVRFPLEGVTGEGRILFCDSGYPASQDHSCLVLGPEAMAVVGWGAYNSKRYDLGREEDIHIPSEISPVFPGSIRRQGTNAVEEWFHVSPGRYRILFSQLDEAGVPVRTWGGGLPDGTPMDQLLSLSVTSDGKEVPVESSYGQVIWSGLSWAAGEFEIGTSSEVRVTCSSVEVPSDRYDIRMYRVQY